MAPRIKQVPERAQSHGYQAKLFRGLADESRLAILEALRLKPLAVHEIVTATGLTQSNASNHLRCLTDCGLIIAAPQGRYVYYRLGDAKVEELLALADDLLAGVARRILQCANYNAAGRVDVKSPSRRPSRRSQGRHHRNAAGLPDKAARV